MEPIIKAYMTEMNAQMEEDILKVCRSYGIDVNKERLMQALTDARKFYDEGYRAGKLDAGPKWISVEDRLPEHSCEVVTMRLTDKGDQVLTVMNVFYSKKWEAFNVHDWHDEAFVQKVKTRPDFWMPMPEPPKEG